MTTRIIKPDKLESFQFEQVIELIKSGGQINVNDLKVRLLNADLIAIKETDGQVIGTATIKNPLNTYVNNVFKSAKVLNDGKFNKELGYIATHPKYEGQGHCKDLLNKFHPYFLGLNVFATTRKDSIIHILDAFNFKKVGVIYKEDLNLLLHNGN